MVLLVPWVVFSVVQPSGAAKNIFYFFCWGAHSQSFDRRVFPLTTTKVGSAVRRRRNKKETSWLIIILVI
jgi:hypothetical protein